MHPNHGYGPAQPYEQPPVRYQPPRPPGKPFRAGRLALILVGAFLGFVALAVTAALFVVERFAGTGHEVAWQVDQHPGGEYGETRSAFRAGDRFVHVGSTAITSYAVATGEATTVKRFGEDSAPCFAAQRPVGKLVVLAQTDRGLCGTLVAVDHTTGREAWRTRLDVSAPADDVDVAGTRGIWVAGDTVLGSTGYQLLAFDARDGSAAWTYRLKRGCRVADLGADGSRVVLATFCGNNPRDHQLTQLDLATGEERWQVTYAEQTTHAPTTAGRNARTAPSTSSTSPATRWSR